jgi:hypothetical protein
MGLPRLATKVRRLSGGGSRIRTISPRVTRARFHTASFPLCGFLFDFPSAVGKRHDTGLGRTATAAFEDHQIAVIQRTRAHSHQDFSKAGARVIA